MNKERNTFEGQRVKLEELCQEHELVSEFYGNYPLMLTVKPYTGVGQQMKLVDDQDQEDTSPNASLEMEYTMGEVSYKFRGNYRITKSLLDKLQKQFKALCYAWLYLCFYELHAAGELRVEDLPELAEVEE